jgi:hypothetical protein
MTSGASIYAGRVARARDSRERELLLWQLEGAMRSLERSGGPRPYRPLCRCADGGLDPFEDGRCSRCWGWTSEP